MDSSSLRFPKWFSEDVLDLIKEEPKICNYIDIPASAYQFRYFESHENVVLLKKNKCSIGKI